MTTTKILLADDERMVRIAMESMLRDLYPGRLRILHADNGISMKEIARREKPHIAFVDIRMPQLDGLAALEESRNLSPETQWIILTGYAEFHYAHRALKLGARDYMLKPVSVSDLRALMEELNDDGRARLKKYNDQFSLRTVLAFNELQTIENTVINNDSGSYRIYLFYPDGSDSREQAASLCMLSEALTAVGEGVLESHCQYALFYLVSGELCMVTCSEPATQSIPRKIPGILQSLPIPVTAFASQAETLRELYDRCAALQGIAVIRAVYRLGDLIEWDAIPKFSDGLLRLAAALEVSCLSFSGKNEVAYCEALQSLSAGGLQEVYREADPASIRRYMACYCGDVEAGSYEALLRSLASKKSVIFRMRSPGSRDVVTDVRHYVEEHYMEQIGINTIAELYDITPNYLSKLFHERTGEKFINYLTNVRISNAKRLLAEHPEYTVKAVAEQVGYLSTRYFTKTFYKKVCVLPSEYYDSLEVVGSK